jgi:hypothetical protein
MKVEFQRNLALEIIQEAKLNVSVFDYDEYIKEETDCTFIYAFFELYTTKFNVDVFDINKTSNEIVKSHALLSQIMKLIRTLPANDFEKLAAIICKCLSFEDGFFATRPTKDEGLDFIAWRDFSSLKIERREYITGQCKHFKDKLVELKEVRELSGSVLLFSRREFANEIYEDYMVGAFAPLNVFYVTNYFFSDDAERLCKTTNIVPIDIIDVTCICYKGIINGKINWTNSLGKLDKRKALKDIRKVPITS